MEFIRFDAGDGAARPGALAFDRVVDLVEAPLDRAATPAELSIPLMTADDDIRELFSGNEGDASYLYDLADVSLVRAWTPGKLVCLWGCYEQDLEDEYDPLLAEEDFHQQDWPSLSTAPTSALRGPEKPLRIPTYAEDIRPGVEIGLVVGERTTRLDSEEALEAVAGFTVMTTLRIFDGIPDLEGYRLYDGSFAYGASVTRLDRTELGSLGLTVDVNGTTVDSRTTDEWRFTPGEMVAEVSQIMQLEPGDLITTGAPTRIPDSVDDGDTVTVQVGETQPLTNPVRRDEAHVQ
jgi:2-keto-4-pentenoate hydratase/2-oxohepta-3-ene-1,7-dioic acid hydratase in catechol pathway